MIDVITATGELGLAVASDGSDREAAERVRTTARALYRRGRSSFYAPTALRLWSQADALLGDHTASRDRLHRAAQVAETRGGLVDRLAIRALSGEAISPGVLGSAVGWSTGGSVDVR